MPKSRKPAKPAIMRSQLRGLTRNSTILSISEAAEIGSVKNPIHDPPLEPLVFPVSGDTAEPGIVAQPLTVPLCCQDAMEDRPMPFAGSSAEYICPPPT